MHLSVKADEISRTSKSDLQLFVLQFHLRLARIKRKNTNRIKITNRSTTKSLTFTLQRQTNTHTRTESVTRKVKRLFFLNGVWWIKASSVNPVGAAHSRLRISKYSWLTKVIWLPGAPLFIILKQFTNDNKRISVCIQYETGSFRRDLLNKLLKNFVWTLV